MKRPEHVNPHDERVVSKVCRGCGAEKTIAEFQWYQKERRYLARCMPCDNARNRRYRQRPRSERFWTADEDALLLSAIRDGKTPEDVARKLGRSRASVVNRRSDAGMPRFKRRRKPSVAWPPARVEMLRALRREGNSYTDCADRMGTSRGAVATAIRRFIPRSERHEHALPDLRQSGAADRDPRRCRQ